MSIDPSWTIVLAIKSLPAAKSRLRQGSDVDDATHADLVRAIRADTLAAVRAARLATRVVTIGDQPGDGQTLVQSAPGLNAALSEAGAFARLQWPASGVVGLVADLPALKAAELDAALAQSARAPSAYVADFAGTGTTMLTAAPGYDLEPRFGLGSAARHHESAVAIDAGPGLRHDVDTWADLEACVPLGLGPHSFAAYRKFTLARHDDDHERLITGY
jgi:2-phospho-L-lactate guanylyltransferase